jgi:5-oxoprolinase (ATP-hydrolysing) subunit A
MMVDLNTDAGELPALIAGGGQAAILRHVTSVNIACGGHAGDKETMRVTLEQVRESGAAAGAHPGFPDRANFGRLPMDLPLEQIAASVAAQVEALAAIASRMGIPLTHVKPHGALYNQAARDRRIAKAIAQGVASVDKRLLLVGLAGSLMLEVFRGAGFRAIPEAFADRRYEPGGTLRNRQFPGAILTDPEEAAAQALRAVQEGKVLAFDGTEVPVAATTLCIHSDSPGAADIARRVAQRLKEHGIHVRAPGPDSAV